MRSLVRIRMVAVLIAILILETREQNIEPFSDDLFRFDFKLHNTSHPFLYFSAENIPHFKSAAQLTHKFLADDISKITYKILGGDNLPPKDYITFAAEWNERYGNDISVLSMYCVLNPNDTTVFTYVVEYMDRLAELTKWQTTVSLRDELPVSHILLGFVTAFDFLHSRIDKQRRQKYISQIVNKTKEMYDASMTKWWGKIYLQNHVYTNYVSLFTASLVAEHYDNRATIWKKRAAKMLERNLHLLGYIIDGTTTESNHYHAYATRSITQYVYLCQRHLGVDHTRHPWLSSAFWYYYGTSLPGMVEPVGFGDQFPGWPYGYEANLYFLDRYVLKTGNANWLAFKIRDHNKGKIEMAETEKTLCMHLEYIWYDAKLSPISPSAEGVPTLYKYLDMGVVIYRTSTEMLPNNTFVSFKSGKLHGMGINNIVKENPKWLNGWSSFNPGHEHPDRNSFTFAPHGIPMISEGLKNYKYTYLDNTLMFKVADEIDHVKSCVTGNWIGQIGECATYLLFGKQSALNLTMDAEIVTSSIKENIVHFAGEANGAYPPQLKLQSFYRNVILLTPELLLVVDHIQIGERSPIKYISSFFNNRYRGFKQITDSNGYNKIVSDHVSENEQTGMLWMLDDGGIAVAKITNDVTSSMNNINITFEMNRLRLFKRIAYVLHGPNTFPRQLKFTNVSYFGVSITLDVKDATYKVDIATDYKSAISRKRLLNHDGYYSFKKFSSDAEIDHAENENDEENTDQNNVRNLMYSDFTHNDFGPTDNGMDNNVRHNDHWPIYNRHGTWLHTLNTLPYIKPKQCTSGCHRIEFTKQYLYMFMISAAIICSVIFCLGRNRKLSRAIKSIPFKLRYVACLSVLSALLFILLMAIESKL